MHDFCHNQSYFIGMICGRIFRVIWRQNVVYCVNLRSWVGFTKNVMGIFVEPAVTPRSGRIFCCIVLVSVRLTPSSPPSLPPPSPSDTFWSELDHLNFIFAAIASGSEDFRSSEIDSWVFALSRTYGRDGGGFGFPRFWVPAC